MAFVQKDMSGSLFKNDKDGNDSRPDYTGSAKIAGVEYDLAAWIKASKSGSKYMSISVKPKGQRQAQRRDPEPEPQHADFDDPVPF